MNKLIEFCRETIRIPSKLGDFIEFEKCSNYPDCGDECKKDHRAESEEGAFQKK